mmetsp:Transcript_24298/g.50890  ORF Transcript_24298/g.50890 Transcript_24298/m.50890 type:complete len:210 (+) Transcript_24298:76-705(+)
MIGPYSGYIEEQRDDTSSRCEDGSSSHVATASYGSREAAIVQNSGRRSFRAISKDVVRTFQTTIQKNVRSQQMMPVKSPVSTHFQPPLQKMASEGNRIAKSMQHSAIIGGVNDKLSSVNDKLGELYRSTNKNFSMARRSNSDRGIYSSESAGSWGSTVSAEIRIATQNVVPLFRMQNMSPRNIGIFGSQSKVHNEKEVSFDYQLMKDTE